ncbi:hypothetical protein BBJ28_00004928 [Nothophytophthora sp. Chile5]|nr:hypothetical protein BBJ28_00004928 [Nothophytophthora sp. Chile5]
MPNDRRPSESGAGGKQNRTSAAKNAAFPLEISLEDATDALPFDRRVLLIAIIRVIYTLYFCIMFATVLSGHSPTHMMHNQALAVSSILAPEGDKGVRPGNTVQFSSIREVNDVYDWLTDTLIPSVFEAEDPNGSFVPEDQRGRIAIANKVLGGVILKVTNMEVWPCDSDAVLVDLYPNCTYPDYPTTVFNFLAMSLNATEATAAITELKETDTWVNYFTKQLVVMVATYNGGTYGYTVTELTLDFLDSGYIQSTATTKPIANPPYKWVDAIADVGMALSFALMGGLLRKLEDSNAYAISVPSQTRKDTIKQVLRVALHFSLKFGGIPAFYAVWIGTAATNTVGFNERLLSVAEGNWEGPQEGFEALMPVIERLKRSADWTNALSIVGALAVFQLGLYVIRQLRFHPQLNIFTRTVMKALRQFRAFFLVFVLIFLTFSFAGNVLFGARMEQFSTGWNAMASCMNMLFGQFDYDSMKVIRASGLFFWSYMTVVSLVLLNMMLAIVMDTYQEMSKDGYYGEINVLLGKRIAALLWNLETFPPGKSHHARIKPSDEEKEAKEEFEMLKMDVRKLDHSHVVANGKVVPALLCDVLMVKWRLERKAAETDASAEPFKSKTRLAPQSLIDLFPAANVTQEEALATFEYLHECVVLNNSVYKKIEQQGKTNVTGESEHRLEDHAIAIRPLDAEVNADPDQTNEASEPTSDQKQERVLKEVSALYFDSSRFADLRIQIRLKLRETQQSGNGATCLAALPLIEAYLPMLLAIERCHSAFLSESPLLPDLLSHFPPFLHGLGDFDLLADRLIGKEQRAQFCLPVELTLVLFFLSQLHVIYAEAQVEEAIRCHSFPAMQSAEQAWKHAERFFRWLALKLLAVRAIGPVFSDERQPNGPLDGEGAKYVAQEFEEVVAANVKAVIARAESNCPSISEVSKPAKLNEVSPLASSPPPQQAATTDNEPSNDQLGAVATTSASDDDLPSRTTALMPGPLRKRPSSASHESSGWVTMTFGGKTLHFEKAVALPTAHPLVRESVEVDASRQNVDFKDDHLPGEISRRSKPRPASSPCYLSSKPTHPREQDGNTKMWTPMRAPCALCERRFMRASLPGVVVMKRIYDLRRQWGVAVQDSKKLSVPSSMYATANVCLLCQELLSFEEDGAAEVLPDGKRWTRRQLQIRRAQSEGSNITATTASKAQEAEEIALMIHDSILCQWHQQPATRAAGSHLQDLAVNKRARQSSTVCSMEARNALLPDSSRCSHTKHEFQPWWEVDLANYVVVHSVHVYLRPEVSHLYTASASNRHRPAVEPYPLHLSVSMKTGVGRDCDDILASCVSSSSVQEPTGSFIEWLAPPSTRGRFVRLQCENRAVLHIERVHVFVTKPPSSSLVGDPGSRRVNVRQKLQRAAFCASLITSTASPATGSHCAAVEAEAFSTKDKRLRKSSSHKAPRNVESAKPFVAAAYFDPERAEKRRVSRLYAKFKSLLDARTKYVAPEHNEDAEGKQ